MKKQTSTRVFSGTFSIIAISPDHRLMGVAVASGSTFVGDRVPHAKPGVGVIVTQAYTRIAYGIKGIELLEKGLTPTETLDRLLEEDNERDLRQVAMMDFEGRKAVFTGANIPEYNAEIIAENYVVIGNLLSRKEVVNCIAKAFESSTDNLACRMTTALKAGSESGGDKRGENSAALIVVSNEKVEANIKVNAHANPIDEIIRKLKA